jgi:hypothetical protein
MNTNNKSVVTETEAEEPEGAEKGPWDPNKCSCHISPPCPYCESGEYEL